MQINYIHIYNFWKSLSTTLVHYKYEHICVREEQSRNWKCIVVTFKDNPHGCWGICLVFFFLHTDFFLWICESYCIKYMIVPLLNNLHLVFLWDCGSPGPSGRVYTAEAAHEARFSSSLHYLPAKASSRPAEGWTSWHTFERKASSDAPHLGVHRGQPSLTHCVCQARLVWYFICLCAMSHT